MNYQSDYGYTTGGIEYRDADTCDRRAAECLALAERYPQKREQFLSFAAEWQREAATYRRLREEALERASLPPIGPLARR